jgi:tripartite-type tricarboxylate transporter receptor subunit TctC
MRKIVARLSLAVVALGAFALAPTVAQDYPTRPVTMVVPFAAGGAGDILSRMIAPRLEKKWGQPMVVDNRPGAGGVTAAIHVAKAQPDGYSLIIAPSPVMAVNVTLFKKLPYDPINDFVPLAMAAQTPFVLVVNPKLPIKSVADLIQYVKERPGKVSYATASRCVPKRPKKEIDRWGAVVMKHRLCVGSGVLMTNRLDGPGVSSSLNWARDRRVFVQ